MLESLKRQYRQKTFLAYLAIVRIFVGYHFIRVAWRKVSGAFLSGQALPRTLADVTGDPFLWHQDFLLGVVIPHSVFFQLSGRLWGAGHRNLPGAGVPGEGLIAVWGLPYDQHLSGHRHPPGWRHTWPESHLHRVPAGLCGGWRR